MSATSSYQATVVAIAVMQACSPSSGGSPPSPPVSPPTPDSTLAVVYSTYLGGSNVDSIRDIAADGMGNLFVTGGTASADFPVTQEAHDSSYNGVQDVFVTKLDPTGAVVWSTFLGGPNYDRAYAIELDPQGFVYVAGRAGEGFPVTAGAVQTVFQGGIEAAYGAQDGFVAKLSPEGELVWATYFGSSDAITIRDIAVDPDGNVYLASGHRSGVYPAPIAAAFRGGFQSSPRGSTDMVVGKLATDGTRMLWATYIGGSDHDGSSPSIRVDHSGSAYVLSGNTRSTDLPTSITAFDRSHNGNWDLYLAKLSPDGTALLYATYLGGSDLEFSETHGLAITPSGRAYVAATSLSTDFPTTQGAVQRAYGGSGGPGLGQGTNYPGDIVVSLVAEDGSRLLASTYLGGTNGEGAEGVAVGPDGDVWLAGASASDNFPTSLDAVTMRRRAGFDAVVVKLSGDLTQLVYGSYLGGGADDLGRTATVDSLGHYYLAGMLNSSDWPTLSAIQPQIRGQVDGMLLRYRSNQNQR